MDPFESKFSYAILTSLSKILALKIKLENGAKAASEAVLPLIAVLEGKRDEDAGKYLHNTGFILGRQIMDHSMKEVDFDSHYQHLVSFHCYHVRNVTLTAIF
jgi:hypothetical protein